MSCPVAEDLSQNDCVIVGVSRAENAGANESKISDALVFNARDMHLMHEKRKEVEDEHKKLIERYKAVKLIIDANLQEMMQAPKVSQLADIRSASDNC